MRDDRKQRVTRDWADQDRFKAVRSDKWSDAPKWFVRLTLTITFGTIVLCIVQAFNGVSAKIVFVSIGVFLLSELLLMSYLVHVVNAPHIARNRGVCPACLYDLSSLTTEPDNCTICPECGGAWKLPHS